MPGSTPALLDRFAPAPDVCGRHAITIHAPAELVMDVARNFQIDSVWIVRTLFRVRAFLLRASSPPPSHLGLVDQMRGIGWGCLAEDRDRYFVAGAACRPWQGDPAFSPVSPEEFAGFVEPDCVKIAWTLEAIEIDSTHTLFATETRAVATDEQSRTKFKRYWRKFGAGIILIRLVLLPAVRRQAEKMWRKKNPNLPL